MANNTVPNPPEKAAAKAITAYDRSTLNFIRDPSVTLSLEGYYAYHFNHPVGQVNLLLAYDVLSDEFSLNQASVMFDHPSEMAAGRRCVGVWIHRQADVVGGRKQGW